MPSYKLYKILHLLGITLASMTAVAFAYHAWLGGTKESGGLPRKRLLGAHGIGMILIILGGMGAGATAGLFTDGMPGWLAAKVVFWLVLGALPAMPYKRPGLAPHLLWIVPALVALAAWTAGGFLPLTR